MVVEIPSQLEQSIPAANQDKIGSISLGKIGEPWREIAGAMELEDVRWYHVVAF
jgi:hypothetical protein